VIDRPSFWIVTLALGAATYAIRLSFLAWSQERTFSPRVKRLLEFVPVTVLPALIAPVVVFPDAMGGAFDPVRVVAALAALAVGLATRSVIAVIVIGLGTLTIMQATLA